MAGLFAKHKEAVISLIAWAIVAAGAFLYFGVGHKPQSTAQSAPPIAPSSTPRSPPSADSDFPGYFATVDRLADQTGEREEFLKSLKGKKVRWRGYVAYVRNSDASPSKIALAITPTSSDEVRIAVVYFGEDMRAALFALRPKDPVEITGTFDSESWNTPYISGRTVQPLGPGDAPPPAQARAAP